MIDVLNNIAGLSTKEINIRREQYGRNVIRKKHSTALQIFVSQFTSLFNIILFVTSSISFFTGDITNSMIILSMIFLSGILGFFNEYKSDKAVRRLANAVKYHSVVKRNGEKIEIDNEELVPDDIVFFEVGSIVPSDVEIIEAIDLEIDESALTGESFPVTKDIKKQNKAFMGTLVTNGSGWGKVINTGMNTEYGKIARSLEVKTPKTSFEKGIEGFTMLIFKVIVSMSVFLFVANAIFKNNVLEALLFSIAIAIGLTPELLPAVITVSLAHGMKKLLAKKVIVKHMTAIEGLGNMDILCTDKTGTLTEGKVVLDKFVDVQLNANEDILKFSLLCNDTVFQPRLRGNPIDVAIWKYAEKNKKENLIKGYEKIEDISFNFDTRLMYSIVKKENKYYAIVKGAVEEVINISRNFDEKENILNFYNSYINDGIRTVAVSIIEIEENQNPEKLKNYYFAGVLTFLDKPKKSAKPSLERLNELGVKIKILTGDNEIVTKKICNLIGFEITGIITGKEISKLSESELKDAVNKCNIFAKISPQQKSLIVETLKKLNHTVGYMGDGINDASSLKAADVGISVNTAVDVAKDTADIVIMDKSLSVLTDGIIEGRKTFANTIKYILMNISSNFGNMFSMAGASLILSFLPMLPGQILLNNLLYDASQLAIPTDRVDDEYIKKPKQWDIKYIQKFMIIFGPISSIFDFLTFGVLINIFHANEQFFHTGWFIESIATQILVVFAIRTRVIPFLKSRASWQLFLVIFIILCISVGITFTKLGSDIGFVSLTANFFIYLILALITYMILIETVKYFFYKSNIEKVL